MHELTERIIKKGLKTVKNGNLWIQLEPNIIEETHREWLEEAANKIDKTLLAFDYKRSLPKVKEALGISEKTLVERFKEELPRIMHENGWYQMPTCTKFCKELAQIAEQHSNERQHHA